ncbi:MAG: outer membrane beta-barrel protein [Bacteroidia bacterium]
MWWSKRYELFYICFCSLLGSSHLFASNIFIPETQDSTQSNLHKFSIQGGIDLYATYDFLQPKDRNRMYSFSSSRSNELNLNLAYISLKYSDKNLRAKFIPGFGTYTNMNYAQEKGSLKHIIEASIGFKPFKRRNIWIDAGVLPSPYTNESAISFEHEIYSRTFGSEYSPYFVTGLKCEIPFSRNVNGNFYLLNGWQTIQNTNNSLSVGTNLKFDLNSRVSINWNTYVGDERTLNTPTYGLRYLSDLYIKYDSKKKWSWSACYYGGIQLKDSLPDYNSQSQWWQINSVLRYKFTPKVSLAGRLEYFEDAAFTSIEDNGISKGFSTWSSSVCLNVNIQKNAMFRLEGRYYWSEKPVYLKRNGHSVNSNELILANLSFWF